MVCKENCPYGAVDVVVKPGHVAAVPVVDETRCYGCGFCEHHCAKPVSAIVVEARGVLRLSGPGFEKEARRCGLKLDAAQQGAVRNAPVPHMESKTNMSENLKFFYSMISICCKKYLQGDDQVAFGTSV